LRYDADAGGAASAFPGTSVGVFKRRGMMAKMVLPVYLAISMAAALRQGTLEREVLPKIPLG